MRKAEIKRATAPGFAEPQETVANIVQGEGYHACFGESSENLGEQIGLLLWHLLSPVTQRERRNGWRLFEALLVQYVAARGAGHD